MSINFTVLGCPAPKGSPRVITRGRGGKPLPHPRVLKDSRKTEMWHVLVLHAAQRAMEDGQQPFCGVPLAVGITFFLRRPQGHYGKRGLRPSAPKYPSVKPDLDKLVRASLDPLQGVVFDDDSRIVAIATEKHYAKLGNPERAEIVIDRAPPGGFHDG